MKQTGEEYWGVLGTGELVSDSCLPPEGEVWVRHYDNRERKGCRETLGSCWATLRAYGKGVCNRVLNEVM